MLGEPGIGKTNLVEDFLAEVGQQPERPFVVRGRCSERLAGAEAYLPVLEALDNLLHQSTWSSVHSLIKTVAPTWYVQVAHVAASQDSLTRVREDAPAVSQERMKRELGALLQEASRLRPFVLFLDDLHWADVSTIDMLNYLAGRFDQMRLLVLATYRPADMTLTQHPFLAVRDELRSHGALEEISARVPREARRRAIPRPRVSAAPLSAILPELIHAKTEGSPLFMADVVRYLRDSRQPRRARRDVGALAIRGRSLPRVAGIHPQHDRPEDRTARRGGPQAAACRERAGARVRLGHRRRKRSRWTRRRWRSAWTCWRRCMCSSRASRSTSFPI